MLKSEWASISSTLLWYIVFVHDSVIATPHLYAIRRIDVKTARLAVMHGVFREKHPYFERFFGIQPEGKKSALASTKKTPLNNPVFRPPPQIKPGGGRRKNNFLTRFIHKEEIRFPALATCAFCCCKGDIFVFHGKVIFSFVRCKYTCK